MCLREGDNVATGNPRSSAETLRASYQLAAVGDLPSRELSFLCVVFKVTSFVRSQCHIQFLYEHHYSNASRASPRSLLEGVRK